MMTETDSETVEALTELETGDELTFQIDHETTGDVRELTGTVADHPYMDAHDEWVVVLEDVTRLGTIQVAGDGHVVIHRDGSVESRPCASRQIHIGEIRAVVTPITPSEDAPEVATDGGAVMADADSEFPTTAIQYDESTGIPRTNGGGNDRQRGQRYLVGTVFAGQVLVDMDAYEYDRDESAYEGYSGHTWEIASISEDSRWMTLQKRDGEDAGRERRLTVAAFARECIESGRWMFMKDELLANTWTVTPTTRCQNCGVTRDVGLSREEHFEMESGGREWDVTLRRCVGCDAFGTVAFSKNTGVRTRKFTTGVLEGPDAPWNRD